MPHPPIILVPGLWLGAWAWDDVAARLRADGFDVTALTLPGFASLEEDRAGIGFEDHVRAIVDAIEAKRDPAVLVVHSFSGFTGYAASDRVPDRIAAMVYVDTAPGIPPLEPDTEGDEQPFNWDEVQANESLEGIAEDQLRTFRERALPVPAGILRDAFEFHDDARNDIPSTLICTAFSAVDYRRYAAEHPDWAFLAGLPLLRDVRYVDLPTSHWPMWSKPAELAAVIADAARAAPRRDRA